MPRGRLTVFEVLRLDSPDDPRLSDFTRLTEVQLRLRREPEQGIFIAESELVIRRAIDSGFKMRAMLLSDNWVQKMTPLAQAANAPMYTMHPAELQALTGFHVHRGALASMERKPTATLADLVGSCSRLAILEDVNGHTNLGAILRSAVALGVDGALLSPSCADPFYRRAVRVSMGAALMVPCARSTDWPRDLDTVKSAGFEVLALTPNPDAVALDELVLKGKVALMLGAEGTGLTSEAIEASSASVKISMANNIDSLNVAAAAAVAFYAVQRSVADRD